MTKTKPFNVYSQRLKPAWSPSGRGKTQLKSISEFHKKNIWDGRGHEQFGVVKSAEPTQTSNQSDGSRPPQGQEYYSVRVYLPKVNGYFSQPRENQAQLIEAMLPEFIGPNELGQPIPGSQCQVSFVDPKNISLKFNNGKFLGITSTGGMAGGAGAKIVPCSLTPVVRPPTGGNLAGKTPAEKQPAKRPGSSGGGAPGLMLPDSNPVPSQRDQAPVTTETALDFTVCDTNYAVGDFVADYEAIAAARKNISSKNTVKPRFPTSPAFPFGSKFGPRTHPVTRLAGKMHKGVDIRCPIGTPVLATLPGKVISTNTNPEQSGGLWVKIKHPSYGNIITLYMHLNNVLVKRGDKVDYGTQIGISGNTGRSTGPHLHFELRQPNGGNSAVTHKDPVKFLDSSLEIANVRWEDIT